MAKKDLELYIHIPFCVKKCDYCDFLSFPAEEKLQEDYVEALKKELDFYGTKYKERKITTIFIGGGTPSWLSGDLMLKIMETVHENFVVDRDAEITIECNPGTVTDRKFEIYKETGINRLSIGLQSAHNEELKRIGRIHTYEQFLKTYDMARKHGFSNVNIDLMSSLPGQTSLIFADTLKKVIQLKPEHISAYSLIIEEGTPFYRKYEEDAIRQEKGEPTQFLPSEEEEYQTTKMTQRILKEAGYHWYEISNFATQGYECKHNINYWKLGEYIGFGVAAHSFYNGTRISGFNHFENYYQFIKERYILRIVPKIKPEQEKLTDSQKIEECLMLGLRQTKGVNLKKLLKFGYDLLNDKKDIIKNLKKCNFIDYNKEYLFITPQSSGATNQIILNLLPD